MYQSTSCQTHKKWNESGSVLLITILILLFLTILGISAMNMTRTEYQITRNYQIYNDNLYKADGAVMEVAQRFENEPESPPPPGGEFDDSFSNATDPSTWDSNGVDSIIQDGQYIWRASDNPIPKKESLLMDESKIHEYCLYGRATANNGEVIVKLGYRKAHP
jgi:hypothetical protein